MKIDSYLIFLKEKTEYLRKVFQSLSSSISLHKLMTGILENIKRVFYPKMHILLSFHIFVVKYLTKCNSKEINYIDREGMQTATTPSC